LLKALRNITFTRGALTKKRRARDARAERKLRVTCKSMKSSSRLKRSENHRHYTLAAERARERRRAADKKSKKPTKARGPSHNPEVRVNESNQGKAKINIACRRPKHSRGGPMLATGNPSRKMELKRRLRPLNELYHRAGGSSELRGAGCTGLRTNTQFPTKRQANGLERTRTGG